MKQNLPPKIKLIFTFILLIFCSIVKNFFYIMIISIPFILWFIFINYKKRLITRFLLFLPFIFFIFLLQIFFTPGKIIAGSITYEGLHNGLFSASKVSFTILYSLIFVVSTPIKDIGESLDWLTMNKFSLSKIVIFSQKFIEEVKNTKNIIAVIRKYAKHKT